MTTHKHHMTNTILTTNIGNPAYYFPPDPAEGTMWYNSSTYKMMYWDGVSWMEIAVESDTHLNHRAELGIDWAIEQVEKPLLDLSDACDKYPLVADAIHQLETVLKLHQNLGENE